MDNAQKYMALETAANRATDAWLANDSAENHATMCAAVAEVPAPVRTATAADLAIERGIKCRIQAGALAELETLVDPALDLPCYHDADFLREQIRRITAGVHADIASAKAERLALAA